MKKSAVAVFIFLSTSTIAQNVGIGTNNPTSKLTVNGNLAVGTNFISTPAPANGAIIEGNVGIGVVAPQHKLQVDGNIQANGMFVVENCQGINSTSDGLTGTSFFRVGGPSWSAMDDAGRFLSWDSPSADRLRLKVPGTQSTTPSFEFYSNGIAGKIGGGSWAVFSDARLKENIREYNGGLDLIMKLRPVTFQYKKGMGDNSKQYVGLIAQEVEKVAPQMVFTTSTDKFEDVRMVDPSELLYTLMNAIKDQQIQIEELKKKIEELKVQKN